MYNDFSREELEVILWLANNPITSNKKIKDVSKSIAGKIEKEIYPDNNFIEYITSKNDNILKIYKHKDSASYEITVSKISTKITKSVIDTIYQYIENNTENIFDFIIFGNDDFTNPYKHDLVYKREKINETKK